MYNNIAIHVHERERNIHVVTMVLYKLEKIREIIHVHVDINVHQGIHVLTL